MDARVGSRAHYRPRAFISSRRTGPKRPSSQRTERNHRAWHHSNNVVSPNDAYAFRGAQRAFQPGFQRSFAAGSVLKTCNENSPQKQSDGALLPGAGEMGAPCRQRSCLRCGRHRAKVLPRESSRGSAGSSSISALSDAAAPRLSSLRVAMLDQRKSRSLVHRAGGVIRSQLSPPFHHLRGGFSIRADLRDLPGNFHPAARIVDWPS